MNLLTKYLETYFDEVNYKEFYRDISLLVLLRRREFMRRESIMVLSLKLQMKD